MPDGRRGTAPRSRGVAGRGRRRRRRDPSPMPGPPPGNVRSSVPRLRGVPHGSPSRRRGESRCAHAANRRPSALPSPGRWPGRSRRCPPTRTPRRGGRREAHHGNPSTPDSDESEVTRLVLAELGEGGFDQVHGLLVPQLHLSDPPPTRDAEHRSLRTPELDWSRACRLGSRERTASTGRRMQTFKITRGASRRTQASDTPLSSPPKASHARHPRPARALVPCRHRRYLRNVAPRHRHLAVPTSAWRAGRGLPAGQPRVPRAMCRIAPASSVISYRIRYRPTRSRRRSGDP